MSKRLVKCDACDGGKRKFRYPESKKIFPCPYCKGTGNRKIDVPHPSHKMGKWRTEIRAPTGGEPRFYGVRECLKCGEEEQKHPAGHFWGGLLVKCKGEK